MLRKSAHLSKNRDLVELDKLKARIAKGLYVIMIMLNLSIE